MTNKIFWVVFIWFAVVVAYIFLAISMPAQNEIIVSVNTTLASGSSGNMSNFPGTQEVIQTAPVWLWFIPGLVGIVSTVMVLVRKS